MMDREKLALIERREQDVRRYVEVASGSLDFVSDEAVWQAAVAVEELVLRQFKLAAGLLATEQS